MRARLLCAPMSLLLAAALCACGGGQDDNDLVLDIRSDFMTMKEWSGTAELTADYGERVYEYTVSFSGTKDDGMTLTITSPEEVAGITASIEQGQTYLDYDGIRLETGPLDPDGLSPLDAIPALISAVQSGYIAETNSETTGETETLRICCREPDKTAGQGRETVLWFDKATKTLQRAELRSDGATVVRCLFSDFMYTTPSE